MGAIWEGGEGGSGRARAGGKGVWVGEEGRGEDGMGKWISGKWIGKEEIDGDTSTMSI